MKKRTKILFSIIGAICGVVLLLLVMASLWYNKPLSSQKNVTLYVTPDMNVSQLMDTIQSKSDKSSFLGFKWMAKTMGLTKDDLVPGFYKLSKNEPFYRSFLQIKRGNQTPVHVIFNNIRTKEQFAQRMSQQLHLDADSVLYLLNDTAFTAELGFNPQTVSAMLIPNTYQFYWYTSPKELLRKLNKEYMRFWNDDRKEKAKLIGLSPIEVATIASIVEEESQTRSEQARIAGLYINRLNRGMPLQADPTIKFALDNFELRRILSGHLDVESPYNTYKYAGLPPGPIRIPAIHVVDAVLNREQHNYIYMCAKEDFSGAHNFAASYEDHQRNAAKYRRALNQRGIR